MACAVRELWANRHKKSEGAPAQPRIQGGRAGGYAQAMAAGRQAVENSRGGLKKHKR